MPRLRPRLDVIGSTRLKLGGFVAAAIMALTAAALPLSLAWVNQARADRQEVEQRLLTLRHVDELLVDAETGQRGYVITGKEAFLQPYHAALAALPRELQLLERRYATTTTAQRAQVTELLANARQRVAVLAEIVELRQRSGFAAAEPVVSAGRSKHFMDEVRRLSVELGAAEQSELMRLDEDLSAKIRGATGFAAVSTVLTLGLLGYLLLTMAWALRARDRSVAEANRTSEQLEAGLVALRQRNEEISALAEMAHLLQTEMTLAEILETAAAFCRRLLPATVGAIYVLHDEAELYERAAAWGDVQPPSFERDACWGLRRGQLHRCRGRADLPCRHATHGTVAADYACLPLIAYGEIQGLLHLRAAPGVAADAFDAVIATAQAIAEQLALSLSSTRLRQVLREQSIRDPLTGLFNRRYLEETLAREMARSKRSGRPLSLVVADLDHFKRINDTHGHAAGDLVLKAAARHLMASVRAGDVACRFGGEEFVLILPDCTKAAALDKAEHLRSQLRGLAVAAEGQAVTFTGSFGVASAPVDAEDAVALFAAADAAVYLAKEQGRDRVVAAGMDATTRVPAP